MCEITTKVNCPHCQSAKVVKNGHKKDGTQNFLCKSCGKQLQSMYKKRVRLQSKTIDSLHVIEI